MAVEKIGYANKQSGSLWTSRNANEVKVVVNANADELTALQTLVGFCRSAIESVYDSVASFYSEVSELSAPISELNHLLHAVNGMVGCYVCDGNGNIGMKYDGNGLDAALLSDHFKTLVKGIEGLDQIAGLVTSQSSLADALASLQSEMGTCMGSIESVRGSVTMLDRQLASIASDIDCFRVEEGLDGFCVCDGIGNVGMKYDGNGLDAALLSDHFKTLVKGIEGIGLNAALEAEISSLEKRASVVRLTAESGIYITDSNGYIFRVVDSSNSGGNSFVASSDRLIEL